MDDLTLMLTTIGDLEFTRRKMMLLLMEASSELETLKKSSDPTEEPEATSDYPSHTDQPDST